VGSPFAYEVTLEQLLTARGKAKLRQAVAQAPPGATPVLVGVETAPGRKAEIVVVLRFSDWVIWHGKV